MAHRGVQKRKAFKLFAEGWNPPEVSEKLKIALRTVQRWHKEFREQNPSFSAVGKVPVTIIPIDEDVTNPPLVTEDTHHTDKKHSEKVDWFTLASELTDTHVRIHGEIREKMARILSNALDTSELNIRLIHTLSQCLCRHTEVEREAAFLDVLVIDRAAKRVEEAGYVIINPTEQEDPV